MHTDYLIPMLRQLREQQVRFAPHNKKVEQICRAERLLDELETKRTYTYEYLCYRITDYRPDSPTPICISGSDAYHDLRLFVEDVSEAAQLRAESAGEPVLTVDELSRLFNVSTKTVARWRQHGLISRRFLFDGRKRIGFLQSSIDRFVHKNKDRVKRGERFSQLTPSERSQIIDRARRLARAGGCPSEVSRRIAKHMNRSVETIRYTLKHFDREHPNFAVFPNHTGPLTDAAKLKIYQQYRRGTSVEVLAKSHCRTNTSIYRVINEMRACSIIELPMDYMYNPCFAVPDMEKQILAPMPESEKPARKLRSPAGLPSYLTSLYEVPLLSREQEQHLFRRFNYLKYAANRWREQLDSSRPKSSLMDKIEQLYDQAVDTKNQIIQSNLRLVVSIAKRHVTSTEEFFELVSDGNMSLIRAAEKFDYSRGNKFSTYASWAIMKNYARTIPDAFKHRDRFRTSHEEMFATTVENRGDKYEQESAQQHRESQVDRILSRLDEREQKIIIKRFGLDYSQEPQTLKEVGAKMGVTKERIRQIESRALNKLRVVVHEEKIEAPEQ